MTGARSRRVYAAGLLCHLGIVAAISAREVFWFLGNDLTIAPRSSGPFFRHAESVVATVLGQNLSGTNPVGQVLRTYPHLAGVEVGYGFFAPNIPNSHKLAFELHYSDGRVEYDLPSVGSEASGLRLTSLLDKIGKVRAKKLREVMIGMLAYSVWREHPEAVKVRAVFGAMMQPTAAEFKRGAQEKYEVLSAYDFEFVKPSRSPMP